MNRALRLTPEHLIMRREPGLQPIECAAEPPTLAQEVGGVGFFEYDLSTGRMLCTGAWGPLFGIPPEESDLSWEAWLRRLDPRDEASLQQTLRRATEQGCDLYRQELRVDRAALGVRWIDLRASLLYEEGRPTRTMGAAIDITVQKRAQRVRERLLERQRRQRSQAERALRMRDELFATVAHELRTPVNATLSWARLLQEKSEDRDLLRHALSAIHSNGQAQARLLEDLLDVSQMMRGSLKLDLRVVDAGAVVRSAVDTLLPVAKARLLDLALVIDPAAGTVQADAFRLQQVLWNLLSNAVKFTAPGGRIEVHLARAAGHVEVAVSDTGRGIAPDVLPHVFDGFSRGAARPSREGSGLGLGLTIAKSIVDGHGGTILARSAGLGDGATFVVRLPSPASECSVTPPPAPPL